MWKRLEKGIVSQVFGVVDRGIRYRDCLRFVTEMRRLGEEGLQVRKNVLVQDGYRFLYWDSILTLIYMYHENLSILGKGKGRKIFIVSRYVSFLGFSRSWNSFLTLNFS